MAKERTIVVELTVHLPDSLAREAEENGLLSSDGLEALLRAELRRRHVDDMFNSAERLSSVTIPPMTEAEVEAEIESARAERRKHELDARSS